MQIPSGGCQSPEYGCISIGHINQADIDTQLLWEEYAERHGEAAYRRSAFCGIYRRWEKRLKRSMRQRHFAGEKLFVDYAERTVHDFLGWGPLSFLS